MSWSVLDGKTCPRRRRDSSENEESASEQQVLVCSELRPPSDFHLHEAISWFSVFSSRFAVHKSSTDDGCGGEYLSCSFPFKSVSLKRMFYMVV